MDPLKPGTTVGQIKTSMNSENVDRQNTPKVKSYANTFNTNSPGGKSIKTGSEIMGPGEKGSLPHKK